MCYVDEQEMEQLHAPRGACLCACGQEAVKVVPLLHSKPCSCYKSWMLVWCSIDPCVM
jgi:hypothetical protein